MVSVFESPFSPKCHSRQQPHRRVPRHTTRRRVVEIGGGPAFGVGTAVQPVPFQWSMKVLVLPAGAHEFPAAQQLVAETQDAPKSWLCPLGAGPADQRVPFQDSVRVLLTTSGPLK